MPTLVLTAIGDDQSGLVDALSGVIASHGASWDQSHMSHLAGKFAGIVQISVPEGKVDALLLHEKMSLRRRGALAEPPENAPEELLPLLGVYRFAQARTNLEVRWKDGSLRIHNVAADDSEKLFPTDQPGVWTTDDGRNRFSFDRSASGLIEALLLETTNRFPRE